MASKSELQIVVTAKDEASKQLQGLGDKIGNSLNKVSIAAGVAGVAIFAAGKKAVEAFMADERASARLAQITRQTTQATDEQIASLEEQARALQKVGIVGDDVTIVGQSQLATFALTTDSIQTLTPALLDMVVATKGANATQEDAVNVANALGRALEGGTGALTRYGISLTDAQKQQFDLSTKQERAAILADILKSNFGGLNEAMRNTSEGGVAALRNSFGDMQETIGKALIPIITDLVGKITPVIEKFAAWAQENPKIIEQIARVLLVLIPVLTILGPLAFAIKGVAAAFIFLFSPVGLITIAIVALIAVIALLAANWDMVKEKTLEAWTIIKENVELVVNGLVDFFTEKKEAFLQAWTDIWTGLADTFTTLWDAIKASIQSAFEWLTGKFEAVSNVIGRIGDAVRSVKESVGGVASKAVGGVKRIVGLAEGGAVTPNRPFVVGEQGAELFVPSRGGTIIPNKGLAMAGGINVSVNVGSVSSDIDIRKMAERVGEVLMSTLRNNRNL